MGNLYKEKLKGKTIGVVFGTFAPMHLGHYDIIMQAKKENDGCIIIVSGYDGDRGDLIGLDLTKRFRYIRELFSADENVFVTTLDETNIPRIPNGWDTWHNMVVQQITDNLTVNDPNIVWYVGEKEYEEELLKRKVFNQTVKLIDRKGLPISASQIRENPIEHWAYITRPFKRHFSYNVLVVGAASVGKSTFVKDIARSFGSPFTDEYARRYEEKYNVRDEELTANDFHYLASGQFDNNWQTISGTSNNGIFFADTDVLTTQMFSEFYLSTEDHEKLVPFYQLMAEKEKWDLILVIPPVAPYVNDNFRDMSHAEDEMRWKMHNAMLRLIKEQGWEDKIRFLDTEKGPEGTDEYGFYARYLQGRKIIKDEFIETFNVQLP